jgi:hypothetical protein
VSVRINHADMLPQGRGKLFPARDDRRKPLFP